MEKAIDKLNNTTTIEPNGDTICQLIEGFIEDYPYLLILRQSKKLNKG